MTKIIFIHGINNENRPERPNSADIIREKWKDAINRTAAQMGQKFPENIIYEAAFYGDTLYEGSKNWKSDPATAKKMGASDTANQYADPIVAALYLEYQRAYGITDEQVIDELDDGDDVQVAVQAAGIHKKWLKAIVRALEKVVPTKGKYLARIALKQASVYLHKHGLKEKIDDIVLEQVFKDVTPSDNIIIIGHSLGSVVAYDLLRRLRHQVKPKLFITLGSPLGISIIKDRLGPPLVFPESVGRWVNGADKEDFVALKPTLNKSTFGVDGIENISSLDNGHEDAHSIIKYLSHPEIISEILKSLSK